MVCISRQVISRCGSVALTECKSLAVEDLESPIHSGAVSFWNLFMQLFCTQIPRLAGQSLDHSNSLFSEGNPGLLQGPQSCRDKVFQVVLVQVAVLRHGLILRAGAGGAP